MLDQNHFMKEFKKSYERGIQYLAKRNNEIKSVNEFISQFGTFFSKMDKTERFFLKMPKNVTNLTHKYANKERRKLYKSSENELSSSIQDLLAKINSTFIRPNSSESNSSQATNQALNRQDSANHCLSRQNSANHGLSRQNSTNHGLSRQNSANHCLSRQNSANHGLSRQNSSNTSASIENNENENLLQELENVDGIQVLGMYDDNLAVQIRGSEFRIVFSKLIDLAPEINRSFNSTMKFVQSQTKKG